MNKLLHGMGLLLIALLALTILPAQEGRLAPDVGLDGIGLWDLGLYGGLKGLELVPDVDSRALLYLRGGYVEDYYYRDTAGLMDLAADNTDFNKWYLVARLGLELGLVHDAILGKNSLFGRIFVRSLLAEHIFGDLVDPLLLDSGLPDMANAWETSLFAGLFLDQVGFNPWLQSNHGYALEGSVEWTPGLTFNQLNGAVDYLRANFTGKLYVPLFENDQLGLYLMDRVMADGLFGAAIPGLARRRMGGFWQTAAPGGVVRGTDNGRYDTYLKLVNNLELRFHFLPLFATADQPEARILVPELFAFCDAAALDDLDYQFGTVLVSAGGGLILNLRFIGIKFDLGYYVAYNFLEGSFSAFNLVLGGHHF
ncbi:MAG: hypothetical protein A2087_06505 [Spirochaetes bacterium GWD1_61_31]|nr:MAG: hypothetical protein A2Y37_08965 [Spirochaetes bacterium GWB1_60_80]OHD31902.1 MAG: hypothetical protein A2004_10350 [Spirochaetes bacterium GWC1_61_12]OHD40001.1 MAG: hypothetical protein A2087_06505 [Spirochaetes bacterium GWD1_61_31]OHD42345.1 MAG: hypothetical protein A2Y35_11495 [Spirochaetes bacterium GWE1_60_18]OHD60517.1 MAG: hypothetical protein A2Y32_03710 [Spirochaetes bacterium GWF1_60_12]HAW86955.1 hypothetical protein [Spirochaetaceae bacterium]